MANLRRMGDDEAAEVMGVLAARGGTARTAESWEQDKMTALVLGEQGAIAAAMPLSRRVVRAAGGVGLGRQEAGTMPAPQFAEDAGKMPAPQAAAGRALRVGWLSSNQFASRMSLRRQTRGTAGEWASLLPEVEALIVLRRDEPSLAGRWYGHTGFHDVLSVRCLYLDMEAPPGAMRESASGGAEGARNAGRYHVQVVTPGLTAGEGQWDAAGWQGQMLSVYQDVYGACGGAPLRSADFWRGALGHHYYREHYQFQIIGLWSSPMGLAGVTAGRMPAPQDTGGNAGGGAAGAMLMGYAVVGWSGWHSKRPRMDILELATRQWDTAVAAELIHTTSQLAWSKNVRQVRAVISVHDPYRGHLTRMGFVDRWGYAMLAKWLQPQRYLDRLAHELPGEVGDFSVRLTTPGEVPLTLRHGTVGGGMPVLSLQTDGRTLARMLLNRTDVAAAVRDGTIVGSVPLGEGEVAKLSMCFPWTPWVFHLVDYI